jgi:hypothetical protein
MSTNHRILVLLGLTMVGSLGWAARANNNADADEPPPPGSPPPIGAVLSPQRERFLLATDGKIVSGVVIEEESQYIVNKRVGALRFPKKRVEGVFDSILAVYQHKLAQFPESDADERFKLARWCLSVNLTAQAKEQLTKVVEINSKNRQAQFMLASIEQEAARVAQRQRDPEVRQTRGDSMNEDRPVALDTAVIRGAQREMGIANIPVIFDLPRPAALRAAQDFNRRVHPLLQALCAKCHNEDYQGPFQLVPFKTRADRTPEALRANLDVTLQFINKENPSKSELLSTTLLPHGSGPNRRPIFQASNDQAYRVLATWVNNLRPASKVVGDVPRTATGRAGNNEIETFAADHDRIGREPVELNLPGYTGRSEQPAFAGDNSRQSRTPRPARPDPAGGPVRHDPNDTGPLEFPIPFAVSGVRPALPSSVPAPKSPAPADLKTSSGQSAPKDKPASKKAAKSELKLDPELLQRALQSRNLNRQ